MNKKTIWGIVIVVIIIIIIAISRGGSSSQKSGDFTIGAVLPLSGPSALWGETVKNGIELALTDKTGIKVLYEDSKGLPADGISAFSNLQVRGVDLTVSELSAVSVALSKIALEKKIPFFVTLVAASSTAIVNEYTTRYYTDPAHYTGPAFNDPISPVVSAKKIAVLYRNDELGISVRDEIKSLAATKGKEIIYIDSFKPSETDFSTLMSKVKASGADVLIFVPTTPGEAIGIVKTAAQLQIGMPMVEAVQYSQMLAIAHKFQVFHSIRPRMTFLSKAIRRKLSKHSTKKNLLKNQTSDQHMDMMF